MTRQICPPDHAHDQTDTCYNRHCCGCDPCRERNNANHRRLRRLRAYGMPTSPFVDAEPAREHIAHLREFGMGVRQIARLSGYDHGRVSFLVWGRASRAVDGRHRPATPPARIGSKFANAILAVKPDLDALSDGTHIPARGTRRRIQALAALGWTLTEIADMIGTGQNRMSFVLYHQQHVTVATHRAVADLFAKLWDSIPPESVENRFIRARARNHAASRGWLPPLAWDDIDNDPTPPKPEKDGGHVDEIAIEQAMHGDRVPLTHAEKRIVVERLHARRWSDRRIAQFAGFDERTALRIRHNELHLPAWDQHEVVRKDAA